MQKGLNRIAAPLRIKILLRSLLLLFLLALTAAAADTNVIWSLQPVTKPTPPKTKNQRWAKTPIDQFILAKLEEKGMKPSAPADKRTLLRRVTFDLTGLSPTPEEMTAFLKDSSPKAFEKVVDRLLASPRYGERWARHWLDVVHYGDSHGHDQDRPRANAWPYRDYVIHAFNSDKPYAEFVEQQLAGDVLYPEKPEGIVATGFIAGGPWDLSTLMAIMEDTVDKKIGRYLDRDDMITTAISTFVSTTVHCARCHDHKFDPIPQQDYYALQAVFAGVDRADRPYDEDPAVNQKRQSLLRRKTALEIKDQKFLETLLEPEMQTRLDEWERSQGGEKQWEVLNPTSFRTASAAVMTKQADSSLLVSGESPKTDIYTITASTTLQHITGIRLEVMTDASHPRNGPGRQPDNGNFHLSEFRVTAAAVGTTNAKPLLIQSATADFNQDNWTIAKAIDGDTNTAWGIFPETGKPHYAYFELKDDAGFTNGTTLTFTLEQVHGREHTILRPRLSVTTSPRPVRVDSKPENIRNILVVEQSKRTKEQRGELAAWYLKTRIEKELAALPPPKFVYAAANDFESKGNFTAAKAPRPVHVLKRGDVTKPGDEAVAGALSCVKDLSSRFDLADPKDESARRAALAKWITDPRNRLAWRSIVNRVWQYHFGQGIVNTPNDFGRMGSAPSHPELLDWLASWFLENGGSIKKLHRLMLLSATYQQSSQNQPEYSQQDSGNVYLWRMNRTRLDAESVRDTLVQFSGHLDLTMGGEPVKQFYMEDPEPMNTPKIDYGKFDLESPANSRRSIYRLIFRSIPDPFLDALDCADASNWTPVRNVSMTSLQALAMWNDRFVLRECELIADRVAKEKTPDAQIAQAFNLVLNRKPTRQEQKTFADYGKKHGMANVCRVLLNSNEFMFLN